MTLFSLCVLALAYHALSASGLGETSDLQGDEAAFLLAAEAGDLASVQRLSKKLGPSLRALRVRSLSLSLSLSLSSIQRALFIPNARAMLQHE